MVGCWVLLPVDFSPMFTGASGWKIKTINRIIGLSALQSGVIDYNIPCESSVYLHFLICVLLEFHCFFKGHTFSLLFPQRITSQVQVLEVTEHGSCSQCGNSNSLQGRLSLRHGPSGRDAAETGPEYHARRRRIHRGAETCQRLQRKSDHSRKQPLLNRQL